MTAKELKVLQTYTRHIVFPSWEVAALYASALLERRVTVAELREAN